MFRLTLFFLVMSLLVGCGCKKPVVNSIPPPKNEYSSRIYPVEPTPPQKKEPPTCLSEAIKKAPRLEEERKSRWYAEEVLNWGVIGDWEIVKTKLCKVLFLQIGYLLFPDGSLVKTADPSEKLVFSKTVSNKLFRLYWCRLKQLEQRNQSTTTNNDLVIDFSDCK